MVLPEITDARVPEDSARLVSEPRCYDCLTTDVAVKVIDQHGFEHWFCAADWQSQQDFHDRVMALLDDARAKLEAGWTAVRPPAGSRNPGGGASAEVIGGPDEGT